MDNSNCPHLTEVAYNGYEECDLGKACDLDCEWIELQKYKKCIEEIKKEALPYKKEIKGICGECEAYDDCHACCLDNINCYKHKSPNTEACNKFIPDLDPSVLTLNIILKRIEDLTNL